MLRTIDAKLQEQTQNLNPEYAVIMPTVEPGTLLPVLIMLHGSDGAGENIRRVMMQPRRMAESIGTFEKGPCIVVAPQCLTRPPEGKGWLPDDLNLLLADITATLPVDTQRIYLTGVSMGGYGTWAWGAQNPEHFAAIAPVVGGLGPGGPKDVTPDLAAWATALAAIPVWAFAGAEDRIVPAERAERMIAAIRAAGGTDAKLTVYPDEGHGAGRVVYSTAPFYDWLFAQKREPATD